MMTRSQFCSEEQLNVDIKEAKATDCTSSSCWICCKETGKFSIHDETICDCFKYLTTIEVVRRDGAPEMICKVCVDSLLAFREFRNKCENAYNVNFLKGMQQLSTNIKTNIKIEGDKAMMNSFVIIHRDNDFGSNYVAGNERDDFYDAGFEEIDVLENKLEPRDIDCESQDDTLEGVKQKTEENSVNEYVSKDFSHAHNLKKQCQPEFNANGKVQCNICGSLFTQISSLKQHMLKHTGLRPFVCEFCQKTFTRRTCLINHRRLHTGDRPYQCDECILSFTTKDRMMRHKKRDHKEDGCNENVKRKYICTVCKSPYNSHLLVELHMQQEHAEHIKYKKAHKISSVQDTSISSNSTAIATSSKYCDKCHQMFSSEWELLAHQEGHIVSKVYKCKECKKVFSRKCDILYHQLRSHINSEELINKIIHSDESVDETSCDEDKPLTIRIQEMRFLKRLQKNKNKVKNTALEILSSFKCRGSREKQMDEHKCPICKKVFTTGPSLKVHLRSHTGDKPFSCEYCAKAFARTSVLKVHMRTHTGERPYKCSYCEMAYATKYALFVHVQHAHEDNGDITFSSKCTWCGKVFPNDEELKKHLPEHEKMNDQTYKCNICCKGFIELYEFKDHLETHNFPHQHQCGICLMSFKEKYKLEFHLKSHSVNHQSCKKCGQEFVLK